MSRETLQIPIVICSTSLNLIHELEGWLEGKGVIAIAKPFTPDELLAAVENLSISNRVRLLLNGTRSWRMRGPPMLRMRVSP